MGESLEVTVTDFNGLMPPEGTKAYHSDGTSSDPDVEPVAPFTYFEHVMDETADDPRYWSAIVSTPQDNQEEPYMLGLLLEDGTLRWSFEAGLHQALYDADRRQPQKARIEINQDQDWTGVRRQYAVIIVQKEHVAAANELVSFLGRNIPNVDLWIESKISYTQNGHELFIPLYTGTLTEYNRRFN